MAMRVHRRRSAAAGFTLFEVLLALMLMALLAGLALPTPHHPAGPLALRMAAYGVLAQLHEARSAAVSTGRPTAAVVDGGNTAMEAAGRRLELPAGVTMALTDRNASGITFAADGTSSGGTLVLRTASQRAAIAVEGGTGAIHLAP